jgi:hypothetical protein
MNHVPIRQNAGTVIMWLLIALSVIGNLWLVYMLVQMNTAHGSGAAQADFELFMLTLTLGLPIALFSFLMLVVGGLINIKAVKLDVSVLKRPFVVFCLLNILIPAGLLFYLR